MATKTFMSLQEFDALPDTGEKQELIAGELIVTPSPMYQHARVCMKLSTRMEQFADQHKLGFMVASLDFLIGEDVLNPDAAFLRAGRELAPHARPTGGPDLAIEIWSPSNHKNSRNLEAKAKLYLAGGTQAVWLIFPEARVARIMKPGGKTYILDAAAGDKLEDAALLPGFSVALAEIFE
jgi:Uma2 family endonuclease